MTSSISDDAALILPPGGCIGILGGGQLGRLLSVAAAKLGLRVIIFEPGDSCVAAQTANEWIRAPYEDSAALAHFAKSVDLVTYEFENIPLSAIGILRAAGRVLRPGRQALEVAQDRLTEKQFLKNLGIETAPFMPVADHAATEMAINLIGLPGILKTRRLGYDGKGQARVEDISDAKSVATNMTAVPCIYEGFIPFAHEISVIACRNEAGDFFSYEPALNVHESGVLRRSTIPSGVKASVLDQAIAIARKIMEALDYIGVMGTEFFVEQSGQLRVNEIAPRVHNSGHWTADACDMSQFDMHIRAICGWPLERPKRHSDVIMTNLLGAEVDGWYDQQKASGAQLTLYGKTDPRPGRKMGHVTQLSTGNDDAP